MLADLCQELKNWFDRGLPKYYGEFTINNNKIYKDGSELPLVMQTNQYFRIIGSVFNDGVWKYDNELELVNESFNGSIWEMAITPAIISLNKEIDDWMTRNSDVIASPYTSESFGGYSYSKSTKGDGSSITWKDAFKSRLDAWRKI